MTNFDKELSDLLRARFPFVHITTYEEERLVNEIKRIVSNQNIIHTVRKVFIWKSSTGFIDEQGILQEDTLDKIPALKFIKEYEQSALFIILDFHVFYQRSPNVVDYDVVRSLKDLMPNLKQSINPKNVILVSPDVSIPDDLKKDITLIDFELPTPEEIEAVLDEIIEVNSGGNLQINLNEKDKESLVKAAVGLTLQEAENAFARAMVNDSCLDASDVDLVLKEKVR